MGLRTHTEVFAVDHARRLRRPLHRAQDLSHLPYSSFLAALDDIAVQHPDVPKLADTAAAEAEEESVAIIAAAPARSLVVRRPESGSASDPRSRPGTGSGNDTSSEEPTGRGSPGAISPPDHRRSLTIAVAGSQSKAGSARGNTREGGGLAAASAGAAVSPKGGRSGGARAKAAVAENLEAAPAKGFRPDDQRLLVLLQKYVLVKSQAGKEVFM